MTFVGGRYAGGEIYKNGAKTVGHPSNIIIRNYSGAWFWVIPK